MRNNADLYFDQEAAGFQPGEDNGPSNTFINKKKVKGGSFESFNLSPDIYKAIKKKGYNMPTPIQRKAIPVIMEGFNIIAMARTGSGKTGAFVIPVVERLKAHSKIVGARCIILSPTREIAMQTANYLKQIASHTDLTYVLIVGGNDMENQFERLVLNPDIIIATPGRLMHCIQETGLKLNAVELVVYDEADRLFEMGFAEQIKGLADRMPKDRQSLLFSATISSQVKDFALSGIKDYRMIQVDKESKLSDDLKLHFFIVRSGEKAASLLYIMRELIEFNNPKHQTIIFGATRYHVEYIHELSVYAGFKSTFIFGAMDQRTREERLLQFRMKKVNFLIVTDLAARGIDIPFLDNVIHYDFPPKMKLFIHRAGRTARNGQKGTSFSLLTKEEVPYLHDLSIFVGRKYFDGPSTTETGEELTVEDILNDPLKICYGKLPQSTVDEYNMLHSSLHERYPTILDPMQKSIQLSLLKYNKNRDPASLNAVTATRNILLPRVHPMLSLKIDASELELDTFKESLRQFKPKQSVLELGLMKTLDQSRLSQFQSVLSLQNEKYREKLERRTYALDLKKQFENEQQALDQKVIEMKSLELEHDKKLASAQQSSGGKLSKKRKRKIERLMMDETLNERERETMIKKIEGLGEKRQKRSQLADFRDKRNFIAVERGEAGEKPQTSGLWGEDERTFLEEVTMNLVPDDDTGKDIKGKTVMRWDSTKKRHVLVKVDRDGRVIKEKRNESGAKISKKEAEKGAGEQKIYKKWMKKTHLKLQNVGEVEDKRSLELARSSTEGRRMFKQFKKSHDLNKGEDARNHLVNAQKARFDKLSKQRTPSRDKGSFGERSMKKIQEKSRPTRSKLIVRGEKGQFRGGFKGDKAKRGFGGDNQDRRGGHGGGAKWKEKAQGKQFKGGRGGQGNGGRGGRGGNRGGRR